MLGIDISNYQRYLKINELPVDFVIMKATEGVNFKDISFDNFAKQLASSNKLIGCYHFARPDNRTSVMDMENEAKFFLETVEKAGLLHKAILVCDWETQPTNRYDMLTAWVDYVEKYTNATPFIYSSTSVLRSLIKEEYSYKREPKYWLAKWPSIEQFTVGEDPKLNLPSSITIPWKIWQYTSNGTWPGYNGRIDLDYSSLTKESWNECADNSIQIEQEHLSNDMLWAISNGLYKGYHDGQFKPNNPVTRSQLATVLKRFYEMVNKDGN